MLESKINLVPDTLTVNKLVKLNSCQLFDFQFILLQEIS